MTETGGNTGSGSSGGQFRHRIFVYGTLKRGQPNYVHFQTPEHGRARYVCQAESVVTYPLIIATRFNLPFLLWAQGKGEVIRGEVWDVDDDMFNFLDDFEGHPEVYERDKVKVAVDRTAQGDDAADLPNELECWCYFLKKFPPSLLDRKRAYGCYDAHADHNMAYVGEDEDGSTDTNFDMYAELEQEPADEGFEGFVPRKC